MAQVNSIVMGKAKGSLGNVTLRTMNGKVIASQKRASSSMLPTRAQVSQRVLLANLVNMYKLLNEGKAMEQAFPGRKVGSSNYNEYIAKNMAIATVKAIALTKMQAAANVIVPAPFMISEGDLSDDFNIKLQSATATNAPTIVELFGTGATATDWGDVSAKLIAGNFGIKQGDVLSVVGMEYPNLAGGVVKLHRFQRVVDTESEDTSMISSGTIKFYDIVSGNVTHAVAIIGRNEFGTYRVSTAAFPASITSETIYTAQLERKDEAENSYGYRDLPYLQDNSVNPL